MITETEVAGHDRHEVLAAEPMLKAVAVSGTRCLFLDIGGPGSGGTDLGLGPEQTAWTERKTACAREARQPIVVFMHSYPDRRAEPASRGPRRTPICRRSARGTAATPLRSALGPRTTPSAPSSAPIATGGQVFERRIPCWRRIQRNL